MVLPNNNIWWTGVLGLVVLQCILTSESVSAHTVKGKNGKPLLYDDEAGKNE